MTSRTPVSIVCVYNNVDVLRSCLERSVELLRSEAPAVELLPVDNSTGRFKSAGAALNHGASLARHDVVAFAHQDVYFHSLVELERSAGYLVGQRDIGLLGAVGVESGGSIAGRVRDRVVLLGRVLDAPVDVDSVDEVIFLVRRADVVEMPLAEYPELAWHAYAVEYGLRLRAAGMRVTAGNIPITHNSLTVNLDRLDVAHSAVGARYPRMLPVRTTCGMIRSSTTEGSGKLFQGQRWRYRWFRDSISTRSERNEAAGTPFVLSDIRLDIDDILAKVEPLSIINHAGTCAFEDECAGPVELTRRGRRISVRSASTSTLQALVEETSTNESQLVTNLDSESIRLILPLLSRQPRVLGFHEGQYWMLSGAAASTPLHQWRLRRARPLGVTRLPL